VAVVPGERCVGEACILLEARDGDIGMADQNGIEIIMHFIQWASLFSLDVPFFSTPLPPSSQVLLRY
jgi:hypothetical protein